MKGMQNSHLLKVSCSGYKRDLIFLLTTILGGITPIFQKEDPRFAGRSVLLCQESQHFRHFVLSLKALHFTLHRAAGTCEVPPDLAQGRKSHSLEWPCWCSLGAGAAGSLLVQLCSELPCAGGSWAGASLPPAHLRSFTLQAGRLFQEAPG